MLMITNIHKFVTVKDAMYCAHHDKITPLLIACNVFKHLIHYLKIFILVGPMFCCKQTEANNSHVNEITNVMENQFLKLIHCTLNDSINDTSNY